MVEDGFDGSGLGDLLAASRVAGSGPTKMMTRTKRKRRTNVDVLSMFWVVPVLVAFAAFRQLQAANRRPKIWRNE